MKLLGSNIEDMRGQRFGRLTVIRFSHTSLGGTRWECRCDCGGKSVTTSTKLRSGHSTSCGCRRREASGARLRKHGIVNGGAHRAEIDSYQHMKNRCLNPRDAAFDRYGGRGICICARWVNGEDGRSGFQCFFEDMGPRPSKDHSLDRFPDNDGNYEPDNCRWATKKQQARNRRSNRIVQMQGETMSLAEACERFGLSYAKLNSRLSKGFSFERALAQPYRRSPSL